MKKSLSILLLFSLFILQQINSLQDPPPYDVSEEINLCKNSNKTQPLNYLGASLVSNSDDPKDLVLCPGDAFGDLNETYVLLENCYLTMYHKNRLIWSSKINPGWRFLQQRIYDDDEICAFSLQRNGGLILHKEVQVFICGGNHYKTPIYLWDSQTNLHPVKTELKVHNQQVQIVQTFKNGTQRLFYADEDHQEFAEDMGEPIKIADKFIITTHSEEDKVILRRNEYVGNLNGTHIILASNCELRLINKNKTIWSFEPPFRHEMNCTLNVGKDNKIEISSVLTHYKRDYDRESIIKSDASLEVVESRITFEDNQPVIIQTLKNGSQLIFCAGPGRNLGLSLKREFTQIAQKTFPILDDSDDSETSNDSDDDSSISIIERMDYIGNLTGLHLILAQNCSLILANGSKHLWEFEGEPSNYDDPVMDCFVEIDAAGDIKVEKALTSGSQWDQRLLQRSVTSRGEGSIWVEFTLENDQIILKKEHSYRGPDYYYASSKTHGTFFRFLAESSVSTSVDSEDYRIEILPKMGFIGDLDGVYTILDKNCNWVLYNKTQVLWESGTSMSYAWNRCALMTQSDGAIMILAQGHNRRREIIWSGLGLSSTASIVTQEILKAELKLENGELWLTKDFRDGTIHIYKAIKGANSFAFISKSYAHSFGLEL